MILWGLAVAAITAPVLAAVTPSMWPMMDGREVALRASMAVLNHGGPLLLGRHGAGGQFYPLGVHDDYGIYVYLPLLSRLFGVADPVVMMRDVYFALVLLSTALYPTIFYRLTGSGLAGLASPMMFVVCILSVGFIDLYWIPAWGALTLLPLIFLLARDWPRFGLVSAVGVALVASWLSSIRSYSGLGIAIAVGVTLLLRRWRWWRIVPALAVVTCVYLSINTFIFSAIRAERDHRLGSAANALRLQAPHAIWHTAYAGLGYLPNEYGLSYSDDVPSNRVQREAPGTIFLSRRYETIIREAYLRFVREHPVEVVRQYSAKVLVLVADTAPYLLVVLMTLPAVLLLAPDRLIVRRYCVLAIPATIVAFLPAILAVPLQAYEQGLYGVLGLMGIVGACWTLRLVEATAQRGARLGLPRRRIFLGTLARGATPGWRSARASVIAVAILIAVSLGGYFVRQDAVRWIGGPYGVLMEHIGA